MFQEGTMNLFEKLIPHLVFVAALVPTFLLLAAAAISLANPEPSLGMSLPLQTAATCEPCRAAAAQ
jgi:hypothetical protein